jgi:predicted DNA binding protein
LYHVVIHIRPSKSWPLDIASKHNIPIVVLDCIPFGERGVEALIEMDADEETLPKVVRSLREHPDIVSLQVADNPEGTLLATVVAKSWMAGSAILKSGCFLRGARTLDKGRTEWWLVAKDEASLRQLVGELESEGCQVEIRSKLEVKEPFALTKRQERVVTKAMELGYYDFPRRITAKELAKRLSIAPSTLSEILQRSERKLVDFYLMNRL